MNSDIRLKILLKLREENTETGEFNANCFLKNLSDDLGSIKRALIELLNLGFISESNKDWETEKESHIIYKIDTTGPAASPKKEPERLCNEYETIRLIITIKGLEFLERRERQPLEVESIQKSITLANKTISDFGEKNKFTKYSLGIAFGTLIISSIFNFLAYCSSDISKSEIKELSKQLESIQKKELENSNQIEFLKNQKLTLDQDSTLIKKKTYPNSN